MAIGALVYLAVICGLSIGERSQNKLQHTTNSAVGMPAALKGHTIIISALNDTSGSHWDLGIHAALALMNDPIGSKINYA